MSSEPEWNKAKAVPHVAKKKLQVVTFSSFLVSLSPVQRKGMTLDPVRSEEEWLCLGLNREGSLLSSLLLCKRTLPYLYNSSLELEGRKKKKKEFLTFLLTWQRTAVIFRIYLI